MRRGRARVAGLTVLAALIAAPLAAQEPVVGAEEAVGKTVRLAAGGPHRIWVGDKLLHRSALFDADSGAMLGMLSGGVGLIAPALPRHGRELYLVETHYARTTRGERTDVVTVYDGATLQPQGEVVIPAKRAEHFSEVAGSTLTDDDRFLVVFNQDPGQSLSVVDVAERRFRTELATPGCGLVYAAGPRAVAMACGDGTLLVISLDESGREAGRQRSPRFFDALADPVTEKAVRRGDTWLFVSYSGRLHPVRIEAGVPVPAEPWPLIGPADADAGWRIGGAQHLAVHAASGRLYVLVHQGGAWTHRDPGTEAWVYDLATRERTARISLRNPGAGFLQGLITADGAGVGARALAWLIGQLAPHTGVDRIAVTQDEAPVLLAASTLPATLAVYDARSGVHLRDVSEVGMVAGLLVTP